MRHVTKRDTTSPVPVPDRASVPVEQSDGECLPFPDGSDFRSPLDALVREGARKMLQAALEKEVQSFFDEHAARVDEQGRRLVVRNGHLPAREIATGADALEIQQPRVRDKSADPEQRVRFSSSILPPT